MKDVLIMCPDANTPCVIKYSSIRDFFVDLSDESDTSSSGLYGVFVHYNSISTEGDYDELLTFKSIKSAAAFLNLLIYKLIKLYNDLEENQVSSLNLTDLLEEGDFRKDFYFSN